MADVRRKKQEQKPEKQARRSRQKLNIKEATRHLDEGQRRRLRSLMRHTGFRKKSDEKQRELLPELLALVETNTERRDNEDTFAKNVNMISKGQRRRRFKVRWRLYTILMTGGFILLLSGYLLYAYVLVIENIEVTGTERYNAADIIGASGITVGEKLFSPFIDGEAAEEEIVDRFSYIKSVRVRRRIPDTLVLELTEEEPVFIAEMYGEYWLLTQEMRLLERSSQKPGGSYIKLKLPDDRVTAKNGQVLGYEESLLNVILRASEAVCREEMREGTSVLDVSDRFNVSISYAGRFKIELGTVNDIDIKLKAAFSIMQHEDFDGGSKGTIYVSNVNKPSAIIDNDIDLD